MRTRTFFLLSTIILASSYWVYKEYWFLATFWMGMALLLALDAVGNAICFAVYVASGKLKHD